MTYDQIQTFLSVVTHGNISAAANALSITQSTVSSRLQCLENELGAQLLIRGKGHHNIELTSYGEQFLPLASQWTSLWEHTQNIRMKSDIRTLTIASVDAVNNYTFAPLFRRHIKNYPDIKLSINTHHSGEIHSLVQNRMADIGFVFSRISYPNIVSRPIYREIMYLLCRKDSPYHNMIDCVELKSEDEVYLKWGQDYQQWHERHWSPEKYAAITVNTGSTLYRYLDEPERWAIAPMSVIHQMSYNSELTYYKLKTPPPPRMCYEITNRYPTIGQQRALDIFHEELEEFIIENSDICQFEDWMLEE